MLFVMNYLQNNGCVDCGEKDPTVLDFDHVRGVKFKNISKMIQDNNSMKRIQEEIAKCEVRCANCHRRKTSKQFQWYSYIDLETMTIIPDDEISTSYISGAAHHKSKLTEQQVREIKLSGATNTSLAKKYNVSEGCIRQILTGKTWQSVA